MTTPYYSDDLVQLYCGSDASQLSSIMKPAHMAGICSNCAAEATRITRTWRFACYQRWLKAGRPSSGPPPIKNDSLNKWRDEPDSARVRGITDLAAGTAAEHLVCADLLLDGWRAFLADQNCPYDVAVDVGGRLVRLQVKSTREPKPVPQRSAWVSAYQWHVRRAGKGGRRTYADDEFELLALVALDIRRIAYLPPSLQRQTVHIRVPGIPGKGTGKQFADFPFEETLAEVGVL